MRSLTGSSRDSVAAAKFNPVSSPPWAACLLVAGAVSCAGRPKVEGETRPGLETMPAAGALDSIGWTEELAPTSLEDLAARTCCDDRVQTLWTADGAVQAQPSYELDAESDAPQVHLNRFRGAPVPSRLAHLLAGMKEDQRPSFPSGATRFASVQGGHLIAASAGEWVGGLLFVSRGGAPQTLVEGHAVTAVHAVSPRTAIALVAGGRRSVAVCFVADERAVWTRARDYPLAAAAVGGDAVDKGAIVASTVGELFSVDCVEEARQLAKLPLDRLERRRWRRTDLGPCVSPSLVPTSVRRYRDGRIAVTVRTGMVVLDSADAEPSWFARRAPCVDRPTPAEAWRQYPEPKNAPRDGELKSEP